MESGLCGVIAIAFAMQINTLIAKRHSKAKISLAFLCTPTGVYASSDWVMT
jgi:hypothetical protein